MTCLLMRGILQGTGNFLQKLHLPRTDDSGEEVSIDESGIPEDSGSEVADRRVLQGEQAWPG